MRHRLFAFSAFVSLLICLSTAVLWVRSYNYEDVIIRRRGNVPYTWLPEPVFSPVGGFGGFTGDGGFGGKKRSHVTKRPTADESFLYLGSSYSHALWLIWSEGWWRSGGRLQWQSSNTSCNRLLLWDKESIHLVYGPGMTTREYGAVFLWDESRYLTGSRLIAVQLPLKWTVLAASVLPIAWLKCLVCRRSRARRARVGHCRNCNYDLTGNISGICPECGNRLAEPKLARKTRLGRRLALPKSRHS